MTDREFLIWMYERLENVHGESPKADYMIKFKSIIEDFEGSERVKVAKREHVVTDQGNGGSYCSNCLHNLGSDPRNKYSRCPKCGLRLYID